VVRIVMKRSTTSVRNFPLRDRDRGRRTRGSASNPFTQPTSRDAKSRPRVIAGIRKRPAAAPEKPVMASARAEFTPTPKMPRHCAGRAPMAISASWLKSASLALGRGRYVALLANIERNHAACRRGTATCEAGGTRKPPCRDLRRIRHAFLHSTGQAYKGGQNSGYLQITADEAEDLRYPVKRATFGVDPKAAQARGDSM